VDSSILLILKVDLKN